MKELPVYEFHLTAFEIGLLIGAMAKNGLSIRKELSGEIDRTFYKKKAKLP